MAKAKTAGKGKKSSSSESWIASVDPGNGGTNGVLYHQGSARRKAPYSTVYFPSVRAVSRGQSLGLGAGFEQSYTYIDWNGNRYVVGDDVLNVTSRLLERHMGVQRYGDEFHQFLTATALAMLGMKEGVVDLTLCVPPGLYKDVAPFMRERYLENDGRVSIRLKGDADAREWRYEQIRIWPEGIGAAACFLFDDDGQPVDGGALSGDVLIMDIGAYTLDTLRLTDAVFDIEALEHATHENMGLDAGIRGELLYKVKKQGEDFEVVTEDAIDYVLRKGLTLDDWTLESAGNVIDLKSRVDYHAQRYAENIANTVIDRHFNGLRGIKSLILVGGGAALVEGYLKEWYGAKVMDKSKFPTVRKIHAVDFNVVGGARLARHFRQQEGAS